MKETHRGALQKCPAPTCSCGNPDDERSEHSMILFYAVTTSCQKNDTRA